MFRRGLQFWLGSNRDALSGGVPVQEVDTIGGILTGQQMAAVSFILAITRALHQYGTPAHRLEEAMTSVSARLGLVGQFFSTPTSVFIAFGRDEHQRTYLIRVDPGEVNLRKLRALDALLQQVSRGDIGVIPATAQVERIVTDPAAYPRWLIVLCFGLSAMSAVVFFGGGWADMALATLAGIVIGVMSILVQGRRRVGQLFDFAAGFLAAATGVLGGAILVDQAVSPLTVTIAGVIVLVPGLTLTTAINELATRNLASGTARLMAAMMVLVALGFGMAVGLELHRFSDHIPAVFTGVSGSSAAQPWSEMMIALAVLVMSGTLTVLFKARGRDLGLMIVAGLIAYYAARLGSAALGPFLGAFAGAMIVAGVSNMAGRIWNQPATLMLLPGLILLVPGSIGFRSVAALLEQHIDQGIHAAFTMVMVAVSIVAGLFFANVAVPPRREI